MILTYVPVSRGDSILAYRRGTYNRVDKYLQDATCVGFGGHVVETDLDLFNVNTLGVFECAVRELTEERWNAPAPSSAPLASTTAQMPTRHIRKLCTLDEAGERTLEMAVRRMGLPPARTTASSNFRAPLPTWANPRPSPRSTSPRRCSIAAWIAIIGTDGW